MTTETIKTGTAMIGYTQEGLAQWHNVATSLAPWARKMNSQEVGLALRKALSLGFDPLNQYEVQIWKDGRGVIQVMPAYTLMAEWVKKFKGEHTEPKYSRLGCSILREEGLLETGVAYYARFVMIANFDRMMQAAEYFGVDKAREMFEVTGLGVASWEEYSKEYFAPKGRSKSWKVRKRALVDAYRCAFGMPSRAEIVSMRTRPLTIEQYISSQRPAAPGVSDQPDGHIHTTGAIVESPALPLNAVTNGDGPDGSPVGDSSSEGGPPAREAAAHPQVSGGDGYIDIIAVQVCKPQAEGGKNYLGLMEAGRQWPVLRWFRGRTGLLEAAPWLAETATKAQLANVGDSRPFLARVYFETTGQWKNITRIEPMPDTAIEAGGDGLPEWFAGSGDYPNALVERVRKSGIRLPGDTPSNPASARVKITIAVSGVEQGKSADDAQAWLNAELGWFVVQE